METLHNVEKILREMRSSSGKTSYYYFPDCFFRLLFRTLFMRQYLFVVSVYFLLLAGFVYQVMEVELGRR